MNNIMSLMAAAATEDSGGLFGSLGIDWHSMILQLIAFAILIFILVKWVYPPILKMLDRREKLIEDSVKAAKDANEKSEKAAANVAKIIRNAREEAEEIITSARDQSTQLLADSEKEAQRRADQTVENAKQQLERDVETARKMLREETVSLVAEATEKIINEKVDSDKDATLIKNAIAKSEKSAKGAK